MAGTLPPYDTVLEATQAVKSQFQTMFENRANTIYDDVFAINPLLLTNLENALQIPLGTIDDSQKFIDYAVTPSSGPNGEVIYSALYDFIKIQ